MSQDRAVRTRGRLIHSGAVEFAQRGYAGTTLAHITTAAEVTSGALTFHFTSKKALAQAVYAQGQQVTHTALARLAGQAPPCLQHVVDTTHLLVRLLEEDAVVRAAARLGDELPGQPSWHATWLPTLYTLSKQARTEGALRPGVHPATTALLAASFVSAQKTAVLPAVSEAADSCPRRQLTRLWRAVLEAVAAPETHPGLQPQGSGP